MFYASSLPALHVKIASVRSIVSMFTRNVLVLSLSMFTRNVLVLSFRLICPCPAVYCSFATFYLFLRQSSVSFLCELCTDVYLVLLLLSDPTFSASVSSVHAQQSIVALLPFISSYGKVVFLFYVSYVLMFILSCCFFQILHLEQPDSLIILLNTVMSFEVVTRLSRCGHKNQSAGCVPRHPLSALAVLLRYNR
jgi:hypothetical protein